MERNTGLRRIGGVLAVAALCVVAALALIFWQFLGLALVLFPLVGIVVMIRAIILELRGKRPKYTAGVADLRDLRAKPRPFRPFRTEFPNDSDKD
jgi:hypothetical protein